MFSETLPLQATKWLAISGTIFSVCVLLTHFYFLDLNIFYTDRLSKRPSNDEEFVLFAKIQKSGSTTMQHLINKMSIRKGFRIFASPKGPISFLLDPEPVRKCSKISYFFTRGNEPHGILAGCTCTNRLRAFMDFIFFIVMMYVWTPVRNKQTNKQKLLHAVTNLPKRNTCDRL